MPTNLYGPGDNFSPTGSHVLPALIRRYDEAVRDGVDRVENWGTGTPRREFLHVDDMAAAVFHLIEHYDGPDQVNVGTGSDVTIREIAETIAKVVGSRARPCGTRRSPMARRRSCSTCRSSPRPAGPRRSGRGRPAQHDRLVPRERRLDPSVTGGGHEGP